MFEAGSYKCVAGKDLPDHFLDSDYDPSYLVKASLMPGVSPCLKTDAVPTQNLRSAGSSGYVFHFNGFDMNANYSVGNVLIRIFLIVMEIVTNLYLLLDLHCDCVRLSDMYHDTLICKLGC